MQPGVRPAAERPSCNPPCPHRSLLSLGLLPALEAAAARGLVSPRARLVPCRVALCGALAALRQPRAAGFELEPALRGFRWHPGVAPCNLTR